MKNIKQLLLLCVLATSMTSCMFLMSSNESEHAPRMFGTNMYVSKIIDTTSVCKQQLCKLHVSVKRIILLSEQDNLDIKVTYVYDYRKAVGVDQFNREWDISVNDMKKEPYLVSLQRDSVTIIVGSTCYFY
jgi:hypothetical protein